MNFFHGRIDQGKAYIHQQETSHVVYVRPHLLDIDRVPNGGDHFGARIKHINAAGPGESGSGYGMGSVGPCVEMSQERFRYLQLLKNEVVFVIPKDLKVFRPQMY